MPPLYRMPIVYVILIVAGAAWLAFGPRAKVSVVEPEAVAEVTAPPKAIEPSAAETPPADGILRTRDGLRRKVLVTALELDPLDSPDGGKPLGSPLDYFSTWFLQGEWPDGQKPMRFQIGAGKGPAVGWVPTSGVIEWDTRLLATPTARAGRPSLVLYEKEECARARGDGVACPTHKGGCPTLGEERAGQAAFAGGFPILRTVRNGRTTVYEVASLVKQEGAIGPPKQIPPELLSQIRQVSIAFVIDTTASMQATIDRTRELARKLKDDVRQKYQDVTLKLALLEYRDTSPSYGYVTRLASPFADPVGFESALNVLQAARSGDGSIDESVLDGLAAALPGGDESILEWPSGRKGELATKLVILIGDAPDHAKDLARAKQLARRARDAGVTIATVDVERGKGLLSRGETRRLKEQWTTLAAESFRPLDPGAQFSRPIEPVRLTLNDLSTLTGRLDDLIAARVERARTLAAIAQADAENRLGEYVNSRGMTLDQIAPVLVDLGKQGVRGGSADPRTRGRKAPSVRRGWLPQAVGERAMVTTDLLLSKAELLILLEELARLQQVATGAEADREELLRIGTAAASGETAFLGSDRSGESIAQILKRRAELPDSGPQSLLRRGLDELSQSDDVTRTALQERLRATVPALTKILVKQNWDDPRSLFPGLAVVPYRLVDF